MGSNPTLSATANLESPVGTVVVKLFIFRPRDAKAMGEAGTRKSEAPRSALGYLYQVRYALLLALEKADAHSEYAIAIEYFDDVSFMRDGKPIELIQTKHSVTTKANKLSDKGVDLWSTIGIWTALAGTDPGGFENVKYLLVSTQTAPPGSAASFLRPDSRDEEEALRLLLKAAKTSAASITQAARNSFQELDNRVALDLLRAVYVLDNSPNITDTQEKIFHALRFTPFQDNLAPLVHLLEGWWFQEVIKNLESRERKAIQCKDVFCRIIEFQQSLLKEQIIEVHKQMYSGSQDFHPKIASQGGPITINNSIYLTPQSPEENIKALREILDPGSTKDG